MHWDAIGAIAETIASIGVVISLVYLGIQIRNQTAEAKLANGAELANQLNNVYATISNNADLAALFYRGVNDFGSLSPPEKVQLSSYLNRQLRIAEATFHQYGQGRIESTLWSGLDLAIRDLCQYPGTKQWWKTREHWFSSEFREHISTYINSQEIPKMFGETDPPNQSTAEG
jgi:hypothetical protein